MEDSDLLFELMENIEELEEHQQGFIRSVNAFHERTGFITADQKEFCEYYYKQISDKIE